MTTFLFPGQGAQTPGFLHALPDAPEIAATIAEASDILQRRVLELDSEAALQSTIAVQLTALIAGTAMSRALMARGIAPDAVAGISIGSITAAVAAKAITFADALKLVDLRATLMEQAYPSGYGMAAFGGLPQRRLTDLAKSEARPGEPLYLANYNTPTEIVVTGAIPALERLVDAARLAGANRAQQLAVSVPSHCPLLDGVSEQLQHFVKGIEVSPPALTYVGNRRARVLRDAAAVAEEIATNVSNPVMWHDSVTLLYELGERFFLEAPPGSVLTGLIDANFPAARAVATQSTPLDTIDYYAHAQSAQPEH